MALPFAQRIRDIVQHKIGSNELGTESNIDQIPMIGRWLRGQIAVSLEKRADEPVSVREVLNHIRKPMPPTPPAEAVRARIAQLCQNRSASQCVNVNNRNDMRYFVRDTNKGCMLSIPTALQEILRAQGIATPLDIRNGLQTTINQVETRQTIYRPGGVPFSPAAQCECLERDACLAHDPWCSWIPSSGNVGGSLPQCVPNVDVGFDGLPPFSGQVRRKQGNRDLNSAEQ